jgi:hypothetical protein
MLTILLLRAAAARADVMTCFPCLQWLSPAEPPAAPSSTCTARGQSVGSPLAGSTPVRPSTPVRCGIAGNISLTGQFASTALYVCPAGGRRCCRWLPGERFLVAAEAFILPSGFSRLLTKPAALTVISHRVSVYIHCTDECLPTSTN